MIPGDIIKAKISKCCKASVSVHNATDKEEWKATCNYCKKKTEILLVDRWIITKDLKYRAI